MKIGFTGSRHGMTPLQFAIVLRAIDEMRPKEAHHGCCVGADEEFHKIAMSCLIPIVIHPGIDSSGKSLRAICPYPKHVRSEKPYLERNRNIVNETDFLIACPHRSSYKRGGTWYTIRYALKKQRDLIVIYPDGNFKEYRRGVEYET